MYQSSTLPNINKVTPGSKSRGIAIPTQNYTANGNISGSWKIDRKYGTSIKEFDRNRNENARKRAKELIESEKYFRTVLDSIVQIIIPTFFEGIQANTLTIDQLHKFRIDPKKNGKYPIHPAFTGYLREMCKIIIPIAQLHQDFHSSIVAADETLHLGRAIENHLGYLKLYGDFWILYNDFKVLTGGFEGFIEISENIRKLCKKCVERCIKEFPVHGDPKTNLNALGLSGLFDNLFQRLPRYRLLLEDYIKFIPKSIPDKKIAERALIKLKEIIKRVMIGWGRVVLGLI